MIGGLPLVPHRGNLLLHSKTGLQILTLSPLGEKISLGLKHQAENLALMDGTYMKYMPLPALLVPKADIPGLGCSLSVFSAQ